MYEFKLDESGKIVIDEIVDAIQKEFQISHDSAIDMVNRHWRGQDLCGNPWLGHDTPQKWAYTIFLLAMQKKGNT